MKKSNLRLLSSVHGGMWCHPVVSPLSITVTVTRRNILHTFTDRDLTL